MTEVVALAMLLDPAAVLWWLYGSRRMIVGWLTL